jgi:hypothetical protein
MSQICLRLVIAVFVTIVLGKAKKFFQYLLRAIQELANANIDVKRMLDE